MRYTNPRLLYLLYFTKRTLGSSKPNMCWQVLRMLMSKVFSNFMNSLFTTKFSELISRFLSGHASIPNINAGMHLVLINSRTVSFNYSATSNNMKVIWSWYAGRWWVGCYICYSEEGTGQGAIPPRPPPRCTKCNSPPINGQCTNRRIAV